MRNVFTHSKTTRPKVTFKCPDLNRLETSLDQETDDISPKKLNNLNYKEIFLLRKSYDILMNKFEQEHFRLGRSDCGSLKFDLESCIERLIKGYGVFKYSYFKPIRKHVHISLDSQGLLIRKKKSIISRLPFKHIFGIVLGGVTSTYINFKSTIDKNFGFIHETHNCISFVAEFRTYDFATVSNTARDDICIASSWFITMNSSKPTCIPYTKAQIVRKIVIHKLRYDAADKFMSIVELFLLAICKTLRETKRLAYTMPIIKIIMKRFSSEGKIYRFITRLVIPHIRGLNLDTFGREAMRVSLLNNHRVEYIEKLIKDGEEVQQKDKFEFKSPRSKIQGYLVPGFKAIFQKKRKEEPGLDLMRHGTAIRHAEMYASRKEYDF